MGGATNSRPKMDEVQRSTSMTNQSQALETYMDCSPILFKRIIKCRRYLVHLNAKANIMIYRMIFKVEIMYIYALIPNIRCQFLKMTFAFNMQSSASSLVKQKRHLPSLIVFPHGFTLLFWFDMIFYERRNIRTVLLFSANILYLGIVECNKLFRDSTYM